MVTQASDQAARDEIRTSLDMTLFVEAGAGTGKTTALVDRIVNLVRKGADVRQVAAITFTEAAAAELRDRIRTELEKAARAGDDPRLREAVHALDEAAISTLHAFAQRILSEHPLEARLPPSVEVMDEIQSGLAFEERWATFLDDLLADEAYADVVLRGMAMDLAWPSIEHMARVLSDHWDRLEDPDAWPDGPPPPSPPITAAPVLEPLRAAVASIDDCLATGDLLVQHLRGLDDFGRRLAAATDELEILHLLASSGSLECKRGQKGNWRCNIDEVRARCTAAEAARAELLAGVRAWVLTALLGAVRRFTLDAAEARRADGRLDFHDLLVLARDLVRDHASVRTSLRQRYHHLLIDEFQDTDPLQIELAVMLAAGDDRPWHDCTVDDGRLFFVGDAMQSIYRFRRADIRLFVQVREFVSQARHLTENHRSVPGVLEFVNAVFAQVVGAGDGTAQPAYQPLVAARGPLTKEAPIPVVLLGGEHDAPIAAVRDREAAEIATTIARIRDESWPVNVDRGSGGTRPAQLRDIAILMPTRASLPQLEDALDKAEIPSRIESASLVWGTQEVRDLLSVVRAVDDPTNAVTIVAALRSPAMGCGDDDLLEWVQAGGRWDYRRSPPPALSEEHPVVVAMLELQALHRDRWWTGVADMVDRITRQLRLFELAFAHKRPRDRWRRLRWVLDQARAFEEGHGGTLRDFVAWADRQADENARVKESSLPEADDDAVRILTVHGSKGLQFPIVVVTGLNRPPNAIPNAPANVLWDGNRAEVSTWHKFQTDGYAALKAVEGELDEQERLRLLYVAMTRAEDHLVISVHHKQRDRSQAMQLWNLSAGIPGTWRRLDAPPLQLQFQTAPAIDAEPDAVALDGPLARREWSARREQRLAAWSRAPVRAATAVAKLADDEAGPELEEAPWRKGRAGTSIGRAVHAVLQTVDLVTGAHLDAIARAQADAEGIPAAAGDIERLAGAALAGPTVRRAVQGRYWRELYVATPVAGTGITVEGFVDLLYETPDGYVVVDYKTDSVRSDDDIDALLGRYRLQGATYALALEETLGRPVIACVFVFLAGGTARERSIEDLDAAKADVRRLLAAESDAAANTASLGKAEATAGQPRS